MESSRFRRFCTARILGFWGIAGLVGLIAASNSWAIGLDVRPDNTTCVALPRPVTVGNVSVGLENTINSVGIPLSWLNSPVPGEADIFFLGERLGRILRTDLATGSSTVAIDMRPLVQATNASGQGEGGLLGMDLHPNFAISGAVGEGELYLHYTAPGSPSLLTTIARVTSADGGLTFPIASLEVLYTLPQVNAFHNGGGLYFGPDGFLYAAFGDGGAPPEDPISQDTTNALGSMIRLNVDQSDSGAGTLYSIPPTNPFFGDATGNAPEIFAWGFRQPYRWSFDAFTGELWVGDVGKGAFEEVNRVVSGGNYGWPIREGANCFEGSNCSAVGLIDPVAEYDHTEGNAIIGGFVYRGNDIPALQGVYLYGDFGNGKMWGLFADSQGGYVQNLLSDFSGQIFSFGQGVDGEVYILQFDSVEKLIPGTGGGNPTPFPQRLSETGCVDPLDPTTIASGLIPYDVSSKLYSDGALKERWLGLPNGADVSVLPDADFEFPIGTVLVKNFRVDDLLIETRLFMRHDDGGWAGYSYAWNEDGSDASLLSGVLERELPNQIWTYPSRAQCLQCHTQAANFALGPETGQLNHVFTYPASGEDENQLTVWDQIDVLAMPLSAPIDDLARFPDPADATQNLDRRARAYLHSNCSGCHRLGSGIPTAFDLRFDVPFGSTGLCNADPIEGDLGIPGAKLLVAGNPALSLLSVRQHRTDSSAMPPIGRSLVDPVGTSVVDAWIASVKADCSGPDSDGDGVIDEADNCPDISNPGQEDADADGIGDLCEIVPPLLPDYTMADVRGPASAALAELVLLEADVLNVGAADGPGPSLSVAFYLSDDNVIIPAEDQFVGTCLRSDLAASEVGTCAASYGVPSVPLGQGNSAVYFWGACADDSNNTAEGSETNNCATGDAVLVPEPALILLNSSALLSVALLNWLRRRGVSSAI